MISRPSIKLYRIKPVRMVLLGHTIDKNTKIIINIKNNIPNPKTKLRIIK